MQVTEKLNLNYSVTKEKICTLDYFLLYGSSLSIVTPKMGCVVKVLKYKNVVWYIKSIFKAPNVHYFK